MLANLFLSASHLLTFGLEFESSKLGVICPTLKITHSGPRDIDRIPAALVSIYRQTNTTLDLLDTGRTTIYTRYISQVTLALPEVEEIEREKCRNGSD